MKMNILGRTNLKVTELGIGLAETGMAFDDFKTVNNILNAALDQGINFLDTAECYGNSEEMLGKTISHRRDEFILATKTGHVVGDFKGNEWTADAITYSIDRSLSLLKTDYIDIIQLHSFNVPFPPPNGVMDALLKAKEMGKTRFIGYSQENEAAIKAVSSKVFDTLQTSFSLVDQKARYELFSLCESLNIGVIGKRPIANAIWEMTKSDKPTKPLLSNNQERFDRAKQLLKSGPLQGAPDDPIALSLGFTLAHPIDTAIVGTRNIQHLLNNIQIVNEQLPLPNSVITDLHKRFDEYGQNWPSID